jgi:hypothetical protein
MFRALATKRLFHRRSTTECPMNNLRHVFKQACGWGKFFYIPMTAVTGWLYLITYEKQGRPFQTFGELLVVSTMWPVSIPSIAVYEHITKSHK